MNMPKKVTQVEEVAQGRWAKGRIPGGHGARYYWPAWGYRPFQKRWKDHPQAGRMELAEQDGKRVMREVMERRKKEAKKAETEMDKRIEELLGRMSVPTKADIDSLSAKITELSKKIDELKKG
jgi:hypothetical protein